MVVITVLIVLVPVKVLAEVLTIAEPVAVGLLLIPLVSAVRIPDIASMEMRVALISSCKGFASLEVPSNFPIR